MIKLAVVTTHPIQYFVPIWRTLAAKPGISLHVFYASDHSIRGGIDSQFGVPVKWDVPMLEGYSSTFLSKRSLLDGHVRFFQHDRKDVNDIFRKEKFDALLIMAYSGALHIRALLAANRAGVPALLRGDNMDGTNPKRTRFKATLRFEVLTRLYRRFDALLSVGRYTHRHYLEHGVPEERIFSSPHCVDDNLFERQRQQYLAAS